METGWTFGEVFVERRKPVSSAAVETKMSFQACGAATVSADIAVLSKTTWPLRPLLRAQRGAGMTTLGAKACSLPFGPMQVEWRPRPQV